MWSIFRKLILWLKENDHTKILVNLDWRRFKERFTQYKGTNYPYIKNEVDQTLEDLSNIFEKNVFVNLLSPLEEHIVQQLEEV